MIYSEILYSVLNNLSSLFPDQRMVLEGNGSFVIYPVAKFVNLNRVTVNMYNVRQAVIATQSYIEKLLGFEATAYELPHMFEVTIKDSDVHIFFNGITNFYETENLCTGVSNIYLKKVRLQLDTMLKYMTIPAYQADYVLQLYLLLNSISITGLSQYRQIVSILGTTNFEAPNIVSYLNNHNIDAGLVIDLCMKFIDFIQQTYDYDLDKLYWDHNSISFVSNDIGW